MRHRAVCSSGRPASLEYLCQETGSFWKVLPAQDAGSISRQAGSLFFTFSSLFQSKREHSKWAGRAGLAGWGLLVAVTAAWRGGWETLVLTNQPISTETWAGGGMGDARAELRLPFGSLMFATRVGCWLWGLGVPLSQGLLPSAPASPRWGNSGPKAAAACVQS